jgi:hypothetical protein
MTTALAIIRGALRESNLLALATATLNAEQQAEGLAKLNSLIAGVFGNKVGTKLFEFPVGTEGVSSVSANWSSSDWQSPPPNVRLMVTDESTQTINLPVWPDNGARIGLVDLKGTMATFPITLHAGGKRIEGAEFLVVNMDNANLTWMYRSDLGEWVRLTLLEADDELPFPIEFDDYFETALAMRLNPRYGRSVKPETANTLQDSLAKLRATYRQKRNVRAPEAVLRMSDTGRRGWDDEGPAPRSDLWMS